MTFLYSSRTLLFALLASLVAGGSQATADDYLVEVLVEAPPLRGANGMAFDANGDLYAGSIISGEIYKVDIETGDVETVVGAPEGLADDIAFGPDGTMAWTAIGEATVRAKAPDGTIKDLATGLPMINSIDFADDGRLFAATVTPGPGTLYEIDPTGATPARKVMSDLARPNGFEITSDNMLYGPLAAEGKVMRIDLEAETLEEIADGFSSPTAVNLDSKGNIYVVDWNTGEVSRIDAGTKDIDVVATVEPPIDNLAISADDRIFVSHLCQNGIEEINPETGEVRLVAPGVIGIPGGLSLIERDGRETLFSAGMFCENYIDTETGSLTRMKRRGETVWSGAVATNGELIAIVSFAFGALQIIDPQADEPTIMYGFRAPYDVEFLQDGSLLVAEQGTGQLLRLAAPYTGDRETVAEGLGGPLDLVLAGATIVYVTESADGEVSKVNLTDGTHDVVASGLNEPEGLAIMSDGRLVVAEAGAGRLVAIDPETGDIEEIAADLPIGLKVGPPWPINYTPTGVVVDSAGAIYVSADVDNTILKITKR